MIALCAALAFSELAVQRTETASPDTVCCMQTEHSSQLRGRSVDGAFGGALSYARLGPGRLQKFGKHSE